MENIIHILNELKGKKNLRTTPSKIAPLQKYNKHLCARFQGSIIIYIIHVNVNSVSRKTFS